jgi:hypothetical protein
MDLQVFAEMNILNGGIVARSNDEQSDKSLKLIYIEISIFKRILKNDGCILDRFIVVGIACLL